MLANLCFTKKRLTDKIPKKKIYIKYINFRVKKNQIRNLIPQA